MESLLLIGMKKIYHLGVLFPNINGLAKYICGSACRATNFEMHSWDLESHSPCLPLDNMEMATNSEPQRPIP